MVNLLFRSAKKKSLDYSSDSECQDNNAFSLLDRDRTTDGDILISAHTEDVWMSIGAVPYGDSLSRNGSSQKI